MGNRPARIAGNRPPTRPMTIDAAMPTNASLRVTAISKMSWAYAVPCVVLTVCPFKKPQAIHAPSIPPAAAKRSASINTDATIGADPKPIARKVAISVVRALTAEYIVLRDANMAPTPMMVPTT